VVWAPSVSGLSQSWYGVKGECNGCNWRTDDEARKSAILGLGMMDFP